MLGQPLKFFVVFFVVVEPVSLIPLFTGLTTGATSAYKRRMALRAVSVAAAILVLFALGGASFLTLMGISLSEQPGVFGAYLAAVLLVLAIALVLMLLADPLMRVIGITGANVASRLLGVILGALAVQFVLDGLRQAFGVG